MSDRDAVEAMVGRIRPDWRVADVITLDRGHHDVYRLAVDTGDGTATAVLKATAAGEAGSCDGEARLLAVLAAHTALPVPEVLGVVDEHDALPAPFVLLSALPGENHTAGAVTDLSTPRLRALARSSGRHLAHLHELDAVDRYGVVSVEPAGACDGGRPSADVSQITVPDGHDTLAGYLAEQADLLDDWLAETRFADVRPAVASALEARVDDVSVDTAPSVLRVDHSLDNLLLDPDSGAVTGLLDWEFCVAGPPTYDLAFVEQQLASGYATLLGDPPDRTATVRSALLEGYREAGDARVVERYGEDRDCYALLADLHGMANFADAFERAVGRDVSPAERDRAAGRLRERVLARA